MLFCVEIVVRWSRRTGNLSCRDIRTRRIHDSFDLSSTSSCRNFIVDAVDRVSITGFSILKLCLDGTWWASTRIIRTWLSNECIDKYQLARCHSRRQELECFVSHEGSKCGHCLDFMSNERHDGISKVLRVLRRGSIDQVKIFITDNDCERVNWHHRKKSTFARILLLIVSIYREVAK